MSGLPVPAVRTWSPGDGITAQRWNANVRDAVNFLIAPPLFDGYCKNGVTLPNGAWTGIALDTTTADTYSGHTAGAMTYVAPVAGYYDVIADGAFPSGGGSTRGVGIYINATSGGPTYSVVLPLRSAGHVSQCIERPYLNVGDSVALALFQDSGSAVTVSGPQVALRAAWRHK